jgi:hypothetical protein
MKNCFESNKDWNESLNDDIYHNNRVPNALGPAPAV